MLHLLSTPRKNSQYKHDYPIKKTLNHSSKYSQNKYYYTVDSNSTNKNEISSEWYMRAIVEPTCWSPDLTDLCLRQAAINHLILHIWQTFFSQNKFTRHKECKLKVKH